MLKQFRSLSLNMQLIILLSLLNFYDFITTKSLVDMYGFGAEANPFLYWAMVATGSVWVILWIKMLVLGKMMIVHKFIDEDHKFITPRTLTVILCVLNGVYLYIAVYNSYLVLGTYGFFQ